MASKAAQLKRLREKFFPDKKRLTSNQKEWLEEYRKTLNRVESWKNKFHAVFDMPNKPETIYKEDIERLKNINWKNISEVEKKKAREEYSYKYEQKMPDIYKPEPPYLPPSEQDWMNTPDIPDEQTEQYDEDIGDEEPDEDGYTGTVDSRAEIEKWIEENINTIVIDSYSAQEVNAPIKNTSNVGELPGVRETLYMLITNAADAYGDYIGYLSYLEKNADALHRYATEAMMGYFNKKTQSLEILYPNATQQFATILNLNRPLDQRESDRLNDEGWVSFDFNE